MNLASHLSIKSLTKSLFTAMLLIASVQAWSMDLDTAKNAGLIGELASGYLGAVTQPASEEVNKLVKDINSKREAKYKEIAAKQEVPLALVEKQSGKKLIERTQAGHFINQGNGWEKK